MNDRLRRAGLAAASLLALTLAGCAAAAEGKMAPPLRGSDSDWVRAASQRPGKEVAGLPKDRWTLVVVFRPGSQTCADQMTEVMNFKKRYAAKGVSVIGVTASDKEDTAAFIQETGIDFPVLADAEDIVDSYGIPAVEENHTYLVNPPGVIVAQSDLDAASRILDRYLRVQVSAAQAPR
jgi:peroxiredoxin Q/BCP